MRGRNVIEGPWVLDKRISSRITIEVTSLRDRQTGHLYEYGAYRVMLDGKRHGKVFKGEMAWMDAQRLADDVWWQERASRLA